MMMTGHERHHQHHHTSDQNIGIQPGLFHPESVAVTTPVGELNSDSLTFYPFGEEGKTKWWPMSRTAYGTALSPTGSGDEFNQPFILPAMDPTSGSFDNEMQSAISHFNYVLCRFYSQMILPSIYSCTGHLCQPGVRAGPIYVNPKQYHCILRRRIQREKQMRSNRGSFVRKKYLHESRHQHATKRPRNAHGRFVSKAVKAEIEEATTTTSSDQAKSDNFSA